MSSEHQSNPDPQGFQAILERLIILGWCALILSAILLCVSIAVFDESQRGNEVTVVLWLTFARLVGIVSFVIGVVALLHQRWNHGTLLLVGSLVLPTISLLMHGQL